MRYVRRDDSGRIIAVSIEALEGFEPAADDRTPVAEFEQRADAAQERLEHSDLDVIRVLDDLVNVLVEKNLICFTDLPPAAQRKLLERRGLRESGAGLHLLEDEARLL